MKITKFLFKENTSLQEVQDFININNLSPLDVLLETISYRFDSRALIKNKLNLIKILCETYHQDININFIGKIPDIAYTGPEQFKSMIEIFTPIIIINSISWASGENALEIDGEKYEYIKNHLNSLNLNHYLEVFETYIEAFINNSNKAYIENNHQLLFDTLIKYQGCNPSDHIILSVTNPLLKNPNYHSFSKNKEKIDLIVGKINKKCSEENFNLYLKNIIDFLDYRFPEMILLNRDTPEPYYANDHVIIQWNSESHLPSVANFIHEITHYEMEKIFSNTSNPYKSDNQEAKDKFTKAAKEVFTNSLQILNQNISEVNISEKAMLDLLDMDYHNMVNAILNDKNYENMLFAFQLLRLHYAFQINTEFKDAKLEDELLPACKIFCNEVDSNISLNDKCILAINKILTQLNFPYADIISIVSAYVIGYQKKNGTVN